MAIFLIFYLEAKLPSAERSLMNSSLLTLAPPTRTPLNSGKSRNELMFLEVTEPPYKNLKLET